MNVSVSGHWPPDVQRVQAVRQSPQQPHPRDGRSGVPADQRVRRTGGQSQPPRDQVPNDGPRQACHDDVGRHQVQVHESLAYRLGHGRAKNEGRDEIEKCRPHHRLKRRQDARGHNRRYGIRRVVEAVDVIEHQRDRDDQGGEREGGHD